MRASAFGTLSLHLMLSTQQRQRMWKLFSLRSCFAYVVHDSLLYTRVLTMQALYTAILVVVVSLGLSQTRVVSRPTVVAAFLMRWLISALRDKLSLIGDPR